MDHIARRIRHYFARSHRTGTYPARRAAIERRGAAIRALSDPDLRNRALRLRTRVGAGAALPAVLEEGFALVCEAAMRHLGVASYPVQLAAGIALFEGAAVEMQTGEGKTLAAVAPVFVQALAGQGVHVLTFNDYLARRDATWMGPIYKALGMTVGTIQQGMTPDQRRAAYAADVTYATAQEAGFDFLRDQRCTDPAQQVHRGFHAALVDEADSILIDEARVPLVIAGTEGPDGVTYARQIADLVQTLTPEQDYEVHHEGRSVSLTEIGIERAQHQLGCTNLHALANLPDLTAINCALHAAVLLKRDVDYIVREGKIELVDTFTGRVADRRHWPDGLQVALEAKEELAQHAGGHVLGTITLQHYIKQYTHLCGMTATAQAAANELAAFYDLSVTVIPPNRPCIRIDHPDEVFTHEAARMDALSAEIRHVHASGRPVLVGTHSVAASEALVVRLQAEGVRCRVLNARNDAEEADVIAEAGALGAVTISTNMAGRGTDIRLGGRDEADRADVLQLGGLYVIGTCRHESLRIDQQLRGRAGRQGDPGASRFFISLEDDMLVRYGIGELIPRRYRPAPQSAPLHNPIIRNEVDRAQRMAEGQRFEIRRTLVTYAAFTEAQRQAIAARRQEVLFGDAASQLLRARSRERYDHLRRVVGAGGVDQTARQIMLYHIDRCWAQHLAELAYIREGIHLVSIAGKVPFFEFQKRAAEAFEAMLADLDTAVLKTFATARITRSGIDLYGEGLRGPSATWTYLVSDDVIGNELARLMVGHGNTGMAAAAPLMAGPVLFLWSLYRYIQTRRSRREHA